MTAPICPHCDLPARLVTGADIHPHLPELADRPFWQCACGARVGCHPGTTKPLGTPADYYLRRQRRSLHLILDPLWQTAHEDPAYAKTARRAKGRGAVNSLARHRVYAWLADRMGLTEEMCHVGMFDGTQCDIAMGLLKGRHYSEIRAWAKQRATTAAAEMRAEA